MACRFRIARKEYMAMHKVRFFILLCCFVSTDAAMAQSRIIILGGGAGPDSSELSIEKNVAWVSDILRGNGINDFDVLFAGGSNGNADVKERDHDRTDIDRWLPLARVLSSKSSLMTVYRKNVVANLELASTRDNVIELFKERLQELSAGDDILIIYQGHGGYASKDTNMNYLRLWGDTKLTMDELIDVFAAQPKNTTLRFVFPQCYSGSFVKLIHDSPDDFTLSSVNTQRCGFIAVPDNRESEGCTVEDDESKYVDFSTYFFAALNGKTRYGKPLELNPDQNNDGAVDYREAYFYASMVASSRDVPRSTSEYFLELWEPWYVRWLPFNAADMDSEYRQVAVHIAGNIGIDLTPEQGGFINAVHAHRKKADSAYRDATKALSALQKEEKSVRDKLKSEINYRWPKAKHAYTDDFLVFVENDLVQVTQWLLSQTAYRELVDIQDKIERVEDKVLHAERNQGMTMRLLRAISLAKLQNAFLRFGSSEHLKIYNELLECEQWGGPAKNQ